MRDGIYKNLPLGRSWKSFLKSCEREKERAETARAKAQRAIVTELAAEVSAEFVQRLIAKAVHGESLLPGISAIDQELTSRDLGGNNSPVENDVLANAKRLETEGTRGKEIVHKALHQSIENLKHRRLRQIEQHCLTNAGTRCKPVIKAARAAVETANTSSVVDQLVRGEKPKGVRFRRPVDLDEDLTKVN